MFTLIRMAQTGHRSEEELKSILRPIPGRFPLVLRLRYKAKSENGTVFGSGYTEWIGSKGIAFSAGEGIREQMRTEVAIEWPFLLENRVRLQLTMEATVTRIVEGIAEARILNYDFRTRGALAGVDKPDAPGAPLVAPDRALAVGASAHS